MATIKVRKVRNALTKKGFVEDRSKDHIYFFYRPDDKKHSIHTKISHGEVDIDDSLIRFMAKQIKLDRDEFLKFVMCTLSKDEYIGKMQEREIL